VLTATVAPVQTAAASDSRVVVSVNASSQAVSAHIRGIRGARCTLMVMAKKASVSFAPVTLNARGCGTITWPVPEAAPSGKWTFSVVCVKGHRTKRAKARITLVNRGSGISGLVKDKNEGGGKGGGSQSCAPIASPPGGGEVCFIGDPFATYGSPGEDIGQCTWYAAGRRPDLDGITVGNASEWLEEAKGKVPEGTVPVAGAIAVNTTADGGVGHVAFVEEVKNGGSTLVLDEANLENNGQVYLGIETPASEFAGYIYGGPAGNGPGSTSTPPPETPPPPPPPKTFPEISGPGPTHTFKDYQNISEQGESIPDNTTVQVTCRAEGAAVEDGNRWWYELASPPYNNTYWASADAFYNGDGTSGSLKGTPFFDPNVPVC
jgi:surface antigen